MQPLDVKSDHWTTMALTLLVWLCTLPVIFLVVTPLWNWKVAGLAALALLMILLPVCWAICSFRNQRGR
ncbi:MAG: hypothetical protein A2Z21_07865 [Candidatus Fraserbacteria bacterium RBG_16_55_9]|uniref:Uncharacterized protein n=1 Tax=Fraserbacteria sp. (strain RBG_16_55_9) TaxID=1817864 RepID=A0A1F5UQB1_FRAXR|nr:MAG: hypothetical protein A2Z21_07865 [Candidatus Fraserbacteria bacterium RBG_16_55_9]